MLFPTSVLTVWIFATYIPMGGSMNIATAAATLNFIAFAYSAYEITKYFFWRRKLKERNAKS